MVSYKNSNFCLLPATNWIILCLSVPNVLASIDLNMHVTACIVQFAIAHGGLPTGTKESGIYVSFYQQKMALWGESRQKWVGPVEDIDLSSFVLWWGHVTGRYGFILHYNWEMSRLYLWGCTQAYHRQTDRLNKLELYIFAQLGRICCRQRFYP